MPDLLNQVIDDLADEHAALRSVLDRMSPAQWDLPTHAPGWATRDQVAHLASVDEDATAAIRDPEAFRDTIRSGSSRGGPPGFLAKGRAMSPPELLAWWLEASANLISAAGSLDPAARMPWFGPDMNGVSFITARLMETWSHGLDIVDVVSIPRPDTDRLRHVAHLGVRTRRFSYSNRGLELPAVPVRVQLAAPSGATWLLGEESATDRITGSATDFCRVVTQRRHVADTSLVIEGTAAQKWMGVAQAFAGPPGAGRRPGEFAHERAER